MKLFDEKGCLTNEGLCALTEGRLDELSRLEAAEHLAWCDECLKRYTDLLTPETLTEPPRSLEGPVARSLWLRLMNSRLGRSALAGVAAVLALALWGGGLPALAQLNVLPAAQPPSAFTQAVGEFWQNYEAAFSGLERSVQNTVTPRQTQ